MAKRGRGRTPVMYTKVRAMEVRRRVREEGERVTEVCADMGMNYENFLRWCRRNEFKVHSKATLIKARARPRAPYPLGIKVDPLRTPRKGGRAEAIAADWKLGQLNPWEIAAKHGVTYSYAIRLRKLVGLNPPAGRGRNMANPNHVRKNGVRTIERHKSIVLDLDAGMRVVEIAAKYGVCFQTVRNVKAKYKQ